MVDITAENPSAHTFKVRSFSCFCGFPALSDSASRSQQVEVQYPHFPYQWFLKMHIKKPMPREHWWFWGFPFLHTKPWALLSHIPQAPAHHPIFPYVPHHFPSPGIPPWPNSKLLVMQCQGHPGGKLSYAHSCGACQGRSVGFLSFGGPFKNIPFRISEWLDLPTHFILELVVFCCWCLWSWDSFVLWNWMTWIAENTTWYAKILTFLVVSAALWVARSMQLQRWRYEDVFG